MYDCGDLHARRVGYPGSTTAATTWGEAKRPITIDQSWADGWAARMAAARAEVARRLEVCEAQWPGPWWTEHDGHGGWVLHPQDPEIVLAQRMPWPHLRRLSRATGEGIVAQRTERPRELRALAALLDMLDGAARLKTNAYSPKILAERGLRLVEEALQLTGGRT